MGLVCGAAAAISLGGMHAFAAEPDALHLSSFSVDDAGQRVVTASAVSADEVTESGWYVAEDESLYYYTKDGSYAVGQMTLDDGYTYLFASDGVLETGWQTIDGKRYYYDSETGTPNFGWISYLGQRYYVDELVGKYVGEHDIDGVPYAFDTYGALETGWVTFSNGALYRYSDDGKMLTGLQKKGTAWYYLTADGPLTGWQEMNGATYYFDEDGVMATGQQIIDGETYYFDKNGKMTAENLIEDGYDAVALDVEDYKQFDSRWGNKRITYSTISKVGCLVSALAMKYSYETNTEITPDKMVSKLSFSGDDLLWISLDRLGYTKTQPASMSQSVMQTIYEQLLAGNPVVVGAKTSGGRQHYVTVVGYEGSTYSEGFLTARFTINDPGSSTRKTMQEFLRKYPRLYVVIY